MSIISIGRAISISQILKLWRRNFIWTQEKGESYNKPRIKSNNQNNKKKKKKKRIKQRMKENSKDKSSLIKPRIMILV